MKLISAVVISSAIIMFGGCATIIEGATDDVRITSDPTDARVTIEDSSGRQVYSGRTPSSVTLDKGDGYFSGASYTVTIDAEGYSAETVRIGTSVSGWYVGGNLLIGGLIGWLVIDPITGAMWRLTPRNVSANLSGESAIHETELHIVLLEDVPLQDRYRLRRLE